MFQLISTLRRSLNGEAKKEFTYPITSNGIDDFKRDALGSMEESKSVDVDLEEDQLVESEDGIFKGLRNVFPKSLSPDFMSCRDPLESPLSQMHESQEPCSSEPESTELSNESDKVEEPTNISLQQVTASKTTQSYSKKSVAVQCDLPKSFSQGVQWEPLLMVSQSVQCELVSRVTKGVQYDSEKLEQSVQCEAISVITCDRCQPLCIVQELGERQLNNAQKQASEIVPSESSESINSELVTTLTNQHHGSEDHFLADTSIKWPSLQEELNIVDSSQSTLCVSSSSESSSINDVNPQEVELSEDCLHQKMHLDSYSEPVPSTSGVKQNRKTKLNKKVRNMTSYFQRFISSEKMSDGSLTCRGEGAIDGKHSGKGLAPKRRSRRNRSLRKDTCSSGSKKIESNDFHKIEMNVVQEVLDSVLEETGSTSSGKSHKKSDDDDDDDESPEVLLKQMGNDGDCSMKEDASDNNLGPEKKSINKSQQVDPQKMINCSSSQARACSSNAVGSSQTQRADGLAWFSSMACERYSSPESINEDMVVELSEQRTHHVQTFAQKVQSKDTTLLDMNVSSGNMKYSTPKKDNHAASKSIVQNLEENSHEPTSRKRRKVPIEENDSDEIGKPSKCFGLVPYSMDSGTESSDSDSESLTSHTFIKRNKEITKGIVNKEQPLKSTRESPETRKISALRPEKQKQDLFVNSNCENMRTMHRKAQSPLRSSEKSKHVFVSICESDSSGDDSRKSRTDSSKKTNRVQKNKINGSKQQEHESPRRNKNVSVHRPNVHNSSSDSSRSVVRINIWSSDNDDDDSTMTRQTSVKKHSRALYTKDERESILWYIIDHKYYKLVKGRAMWERMEKQEVCCDRTWQSMKEHFLKRILPQIETFNLKPEIEKRFVSMRR